MLLYVSFKGPFIKKSPSGYNNVKRKNPLCLKSAVNGTKPWLELGRSPLSKPSAVGQSLCDLGRVTGRAGF